MSAITTETYRKSAVCPSLCLLVQLSFNCTEQTLTHQCASYVMAMVSHVNTSCDWLPTAAYLCVLVASVSQLLLLQS